MEVQRTIYDSNNNPVVVHNTGMSEDFSDKITKIEEGIKNLKMTDDIINLTIYKNEEGFYIQGPVKIYSMYNIFVYDNKNNRAITVITDYESDLIVTGYNNYDILREEYVDEDTTKNHIYASLNRIGYKDDIINTICNMLYPVDGTMYDSKLYCDPFYIFTAEASSTPKKFKVTFLSFYRVDTHYIDAKEYEITVLIGNNVVVPDIIRLTEIDHYTDNVLKSTSFKKVEDMKNFLTFKLSKYLINFISDYITNIIDLNKQTSRPISEETKEEKPKNEVVSIDLGKLEVCGNNIVYTSIAFDFFKIIIGLDDKMPISIERYSSYTTRDIYEIHSSYNNPRNYFGFIRQVLSTFIFAEDESCDMYDEIIDTIVKKIAKFYNDTIYKGTA